MEPARRHCAVPDRGNEEACATTCNGANPGMSHFDLADIRPMDFGKELELAEFEDRGDALHFVASPFRQRKVIYPALMITAIGGLRCLLWHRSAISLLL